MFQLYSDMCRKLHADKKANRLSARKKREINKAYLNVKRSLSSLLPMALKNLPFAADTKLFFLYFYKYVCKKYESWKTNQE